MGFERFAKKSGAQLQKHIRAVSIDSNHVVLTHHVKIRMKQRKVNIAEVLDVLRRGSIQHRPEPNLLKGSLECRMERYVGGRHCAVVVALDDDDPALLVVTVWDC